MIIVGWVQPSVLILWIKVRQKFMQVSLLRLNSALTLNPSSLEALCAIAPILPKLSFYKLFEFIPNSLNLCSKNLFFASASSARCRSASALRCSCKADSSGVGTNSPS